MIAINTISGGEMGFRSLLYKPPTEQVLNYINTHINNASQALGHAGAAFINTTKEIYNKFNSAEALNLSKMLSGVNNVHLSENVIMTLTPPDLPNANYLMQQYIMANPVVNDMNANNMCYGFQETYYDTEPGVLGTDRNDYRRAVDGLLQFDDDDLGYIEYYSSSDETEDLCALDTFAIQDTWESIQTAIADGIDPTSPDGEEL